MWQYLMLTRNPEGPSDTIEVDVVECQYANADTREEAALQLCDNLGIPRDLFVTCIEVAPNVKAKFSNDGAMIRMSAIPAAQQLAVRPKKVA